MTSISIATVTSTDSTTSGSASLEPLDDEVFDDSPLKGQAKTLSELSEVIHLYQRIEAVEKRTQRYLTRYLTRMFNKLLMSGSSTKEATSKVSSYLEWYEKHPETPLAGAPPNAADDQLEGAPPALVWHQLEDAPPTLVAGDLSKSCSLAFYAVIHAGVPLAFAIRAFLGACVGACLALFTMLFRVLACTMGIVFVAFLFFNAGTLASCLHGLGSSIVLRMGTVGDSLYQLVSIGFDLLDQLVSIGFDLGGDLGSSIFLLEGTVGDLLDQLVGIGIGIGRELGSSIVLHVGTVGDSLGQIVSIGFDLCRTMAVILFWLMVQAYFLLRDTLTINLCETEKN